MLVYLTCIACVILTSTCEAGSVIVFVSDEDPETGGAERQTWRSEGLESESWLHFCQSCDFGQVT